MTEPTDDELLKRRAIRLAGPVEDAVAVEAIARLLFLQHQDRAAPVYLLVDSPGGSVVAAMSILDTMEHLAPPVHTCCTGQAGGTALMVVAHGARGHRTASAGARLCSCRSGAQAAAR
jgi:ATP-dependent Clp protease protease subunit